MKTFIINLKHRTDRREAIEKQMRILGMEYEIVEAVNGRELPKEFEGLYSAEIARQYNGVELSPGEIGCALSHRSIYERMIKENIPEALILEDDIVLPADFKKQIDTVLKREGESFRKWEWLQIDYVPVGPTFLKGWFRSAAIQFKRKKSSGVYTAVKLVPIVLLSLYEWGRDVIYRKTKMISIVSFFRPLYLASAYIVTQKAAKIILDIQTPVKYPADRVQNVARLRTDFKLKAVTPLLTYQQKQGFVSDIAPDTLA